jgi:hypothetical protein
MPLLHSFAKLARGENVTPAHIFDCPDERLIAQGRIILCAASLLSIYLDPTLPIRSGTAAHGVVIAYTALAIAFVVLRVWRLPVRPPDISFTASTSHVLRPCWC